MLYMYELSFANMIQATRFLNHVLRKIERTGYFSIKDMAGLRDNIRPFLRVGYPNVLYDYDNAEFIGWDEIGIAQLKIEIPIDLNEPLSNGQTSVLYLSQPKVIVDKIKEHAERYLNTEEENENE